MDKATRNKIRTWIRMIEAELSADEREEERQGGAATPTPALSQAEMKRLTERRAKVMARRIKN